MATESDHPIRVGEVTKGRVKYAAAVLGKTQGEIVELAMVNILHQVRPEIEELSLAMRQAGEEAINEVRARALGKLSVKEET
jgi:hypothetical protein